MTLFKSLTIDSHERLILFRMNQNKTNNGKTRSLKKKRNPLVPRYFGMHMIDTSKIGAWWKDTPMMCIRTLMHGILAERREYNFRETEAVSLSAYISGKDRIGRNPNQLKKRSMFCGRKPEMASVFRGNCPRSLDAYVGWLWYIDCMNVPKTDHEPNSGDTFLLYVCKMYGERWTFAILVVHEYRSKTAQDEPDVLTLFILRPNWLIRPWIAAGYPMMVTATAMANSLPHHSRQIDWAMKKYLRYNQESDLKIEIIQFQIEDI